YLLYGKIYKESLVIGNNISFGRVMRKGFELCKNLDELPLFFQNNLRLPNRELEPLSYFVYQFLQNDPAQRIQDDDMLSHFQEFLALHQEIFPEK
ncbi:MAG: hypothetical protein WCP39_02045, partial [Chlamydiota bacterium]